MNALYGTAAPAAKYVHQNYPRQLNKPGESSVVVQNEEQEAAMTARGYSTKPLAIAPRVETAVPTTTQPALQSAYDALKRELNEKTDAFNIRYAELEFKYDHSMERNEKLRGENTALVRKLERRDATIRELMAQQSADQLAEVRKMASAGTPLVNVEAPADETEYADPEENLFELMKAAPQPQE